MKITFIGVGGITRSYRQSLKQLERPIAAVCDINAERVASIAVEENATAYTDHNEMLQKEKPDVVFICIPPGAHTTQVADAAASGAAVFVAKPVAQDLETAQHARDAIATLFVMPALYAITTDLRGLVLRNPEERFQTVEDEDLFGAAVPADD
jgi:predicted dehydrogenase